MDTEQRRVLIVDDSKLMRQMIRDTLASDDWQVVGEASDGCEAVAMFERLRPDAVTLDIIMPDSNGMDALRAMLRIDPDAKVVVVSALSQTKRISEAIRFGAQDFIAKPFLPEQLQQTMRLCLESVLV